jgi:type II protein arginine methyltransferase
MVAAATFETLLSHVQDKPVPLARLACVLLSKGDVERAHELCTRAIVLAPDNDEVHALAAEIFSHRVPAWYFPMVQDSARHKHYENAFRRAIRPDDRVLDIGSGTGLFAMMAARAGAAEVITCEANPVVAAAVREVLAHNGLANRVRVVAKQSSDLEIGIDLSGPADVVVWDNLTGNMIGAGALPAIEQAFRRLAHAAARFIPARGTIRIALAEDREAHRIQMHTVEGFDLSPFNRLAAPFYSVSVGSERLVLRSEPGDLFHFDFQSGGPFPEARATVSLSSSGGCVNSIIQWIRLELDEHESYENMPSVGAKSVFSLKCYPLRRAIELASGDTVMVGGTHDRQSLRIWAELPEMR